jgi:hypothetical protein
MSSTIWNNKGQKVIFWILATFAILIGIYALIGYGLSDIGAAGFAKNKENFGIKLDTVWHTMLIIHAVSGGVAILIGWTQFVGSWLERYRQIHRNIGKIYIISVMFAGVSGLYLAMYATGGIMAQIGFGAVSLAWLITGVMSLLMVLRGNIEEHEKWVYRSYAVTFAAVTLRIYLIAATLIFGQASYLMYYPIIAWLCWMPNLIVIELFLRNRYMVRA